VAIVKLTICGEGTRYKCVSVMYLMPSFTIYRQEKYLYSHI